MASILGAVSMDITLMTQPILLLVTLLKRDFTEDTSHTVLLPVEPPIGVAYSHHIRGNPPREGRQHPGAQDIVRRSGLDDSGLWLFGEVEGKPSTRNTVFM